MKTLFSKIIYLSIIGLFSFLFSAHLVVAADTCDGICQAICDRQLGLGNGTCDGTNKCCKLPPPEEEGQELSGGYGLDGAKAQFGTKLPTNVDIPTFLGKILGSVLGFTGTIFFVLVIIAGLMWMTSAGNEERVKRAKQILIAAVIGLIIVMSAYAITSFIGTNLAK